MSTISRFATPPARSVRAILPPHVTAVTYPAAAVARRRGTTGGRA
ncbi:MAG TPA: hypothetical protein VF006_21835 [Longimicrobium sp.]